MIYLFGEYELDTRLHELQRGGCVYAVEPLVFDLLLYLIEKRDRMVSRDELNQSIWKGRVVSEASLNSCLRSARRAIGDSGKKQDFIRTFPRRGVRFVGGVAVRGQNHADVGPARADIDVEASSLSPPGKPSIAVRPFENMSDDPGQEYFSDGMTEDIITALSSVGWLFVIARNSTFTYKGQAVEVTRLARELGVRYIVEGSVRKAGNKVRITAQLIDGTNGDHVWAERYDRELDDIFALQDEITENIVGRIDTELRAKEMDLARRKPPANLDAWDLYQRGLWHFYKLTKDDNEEARALFHKSAERDPSFSLAYAGIAMSCYAEVFHFFSDNVDEWVTRGLAAGERAVALDGAECFNHFALGRVLMLAGEHERNIAEMEKSLALNPSYAQGYFGLGIALNTKGRAAEAIRNIDMDMRLSPNDSAMWAMQVNRAMACNNLGNFEEGEEWARKAINARPDFFGGYTCLARALVDQDRPEEARAVITALRRVMPDINLPLLRRLGRFYNPDTLERGIAALRKAGLPE